jgi:hypothetical protein
MVALDLGISPGTGALLQKIPVQDLLSPIPESPQTDRTMAPDPTDEPLILDLSNQLSQARPIITIP